MVGILSKNCSDHARQQFGPNRLEACLKSIVHANAAILRLGLHAAADPRITLDFCLRKVLPCEGFVGGIDPHFLPRHDGEFGCERAKQPIRVLFPQFGKFRERKSMEPVCETDCGIHANVSRVALCRGDCRLLNSLDRRGYPLRTCEPFGIDLAGRFLTQFIRLRPGVPPAIGRFRRGALVKRLN